MTLWSRLAGRDYRDYLRRAWDEGESVPIVNSREEVVAHLTAHSTLCALTATGHRGPCTCKRESASSMKGARMARYLLRYDRGELGPKSVDEWAAPNGSEPLLIWMLREMESQGIRVELVQVEVQDAMPGYYAEMRPVSRST